jgi:hypothetical protein
LDVHAISSDGHVNVGVTRESVGKLVATVTPQKYLPKPGFQGKTDPLQKIIPTLLLQQLILKFSVSIDFYKRNLFYIESFYSLYNHNQVEVVEQK